ncbi:MAG: dienelactone hydrolase family protein [Candidatus Hydrogenedentes bacterium]|nr:dienelactone hydrolase family protein [Candidatus Hydrogenedentota bacterium]
MKPLVSCGVVVLGALMALGCATTQSKERCNVSSKMTPTGFLNKTMTVDGNTRNYVVYVPSDYDPGKKWPMVVFLHGMGERGRDGLLQTEVGIGSAIRRQASLYPCIVVMPQCPGDTVWLNAFQHIDVAMEQTLKEYSIDSSRIYLTGLSMGGYGSWAYGALHNDVFAAIIPICGGGKVSDAPALAKVPIWAFHGGADSVVKPLASQSMVQAVKEAGGNIQYTEYPGVDHNSWDQTYRDLDVVKWLLSQKK